MNKFELLGRVGKLDIEYKESGSVITKISLEVKKNKEEWEKFWITFFNTKNGNTAEILADTVKEGYYIRVNGKLTVDKYTPKGADKPKYALKLIGWGFKRVVWDDDAKKYVDWDVLEEQESQSPDDYLGDDEIPF